MRKTKPGNGTPGTKAHGAFGFTSESGSAVFSGSHQRFQRSGRDSTWEGSLSNIAAVSFGFMLLVAVERGWISRAETGERTLKTLQFFSNSLQGPDAQATGYQGF